MSDERYTTTTNIPLKVYYSPEDISSITYENDINNPGEYPFTRGIHKDMYRGRIWTFRQYAGLGTGEDTNKRFKFLLRQGQTGLSLAFDLPTQLGMDSDHPMASGEVGRVGVAIDTLRDLEEIYEGIPLDKISTSFTINATAGITLAMYLAAAEKQGVDPSQLRGTFQNDILKEYLARGNFIFPPHPSVKLGVDVIEYCMQACPNINPISISGHMRQAGATATQTMAYMFLNAMTYIKETLGRGHSIDEIAPLFTFVLAGAPSEFFETICWMRASRRLWARLIRERFQAKKERSLWFRVTGSGVDYRSLIAQEPLNNLARISIGGLANILGGAQAMHLPSFDESYAIPTEESALISLRIQQILAYETGITKVVDPLGGSYYVESLTDSIENEIAAHMETVEKEGGILKGIEDGKIQKEIAKQAYQQEMDIQKGKKTIVGLNKFQKEGIAQQFAIYEIDEKLSDFQIEKLRKVKKERNQGDVENSLLEIKQAAAAGNKNLMPYFVTAVKSQATVGEITETLKEVYGTYREPRIF